MREGVFTNEADARGANVGRMSRWLGSTPARQNMIERFAPRPRSMLRQPRAKREKAATSVKLSTWCESTRHWKIPSAPRLEVGPSTGKKRSKKAAGQPISERTSTTTWKMMNKRLTTAQKTRAGWFGTVLPLWRQVRTRQGRAFLKELVAFFEHSFESGW
ncbi:uncharacterized protein TRAVEDRAFT_24903 [Trametes versicolor FP-101664 SS1]|uniref:Uncharacterized protein n=1 Tax=Trametes versicolor (strain FP-101664) TaxID=717944 RepID=R7S752_TRAVS|nr:uncharacterized protein TRAVEDRAFT_24903 [Trametes versicolor FP-101664 SS1]EIW51843.1 hypothetical protein TRAVEDRAFT_24903 [Trametes versicolor FP-101664 SS1]